MAWKQIDCFNRNLKFWLFLGIYPFEVSYRYYGIYSKMFVSCFIFFYDLLPTINFYFLPRHLDNFVEELIFYFSELSVFSKVLTFFLMRKKIAKLLMMLETDTFQPDTDKAWKISHEAKKFNIRYWKIVAAVSATSNLTHVLSPLISHLLLHTKLELPLCSYSFFSDETREKFIYPLYFYQSIGMHFNMYFNVNIDSFFLGLLILIISQLDILEDKFTNITTVEQSEELNEINTFRRTDDFEYENRFIKKLNHAFIHYGEVYKFCDLVQQIFSLTLFAQFSMASCIICVCLFRFTLEAPWQYYIFLATYMFVMIIQILMPCWFGTRIMDKSMRLSQAIYNCNWTSRSRRFKSSMRLFVERANRPLSITGWKMFLLSLSTFTSIINSAYSFFTLLRHMQSNQSR